MGVLLRVGEQITSKGRTLTVTELDIETLDSIRPELIEAARNDVTVTYGGLIAALGLPYPPNGLGRVLDLLSEDCFRRDEPSLAALVIAQTTGEVGSMFHGDPAAERAALSAYWAAGKIDQSHR